VMGHAGPLQETAPPHRRSPLGGAQCEAGKRGDASIPQTICQEKRPAGQGLSENQPEGAQQLDAVIGLAGNVAPAIRYEGVTGLAEDVDGYVAQ